MDWILFKIDCKYIARGEKNINEKKIKSVSKIKIENVVTPIPKDI